MRWERWGSAVTAACVLGMAVGVASAAAGRLVPSSWSLPAWNPAEYDGFAATTDAADLTSLPTVHAVYVYSSDAQSRFGRLAARIQRDARQASWLLEASFGGGIRWDERLGTGTNAGTRYLDIRRLLGPGRGPVRELVGEVAVVDDQSQSIHLPVGARRGQPEYRRSVRRLCAAERQPRLLTQVA
jgi:hypothetical protein